MRRGPVCGIITIRTCAYRKEMSARTEGGPAMNAQEAIKELQNIKNYATASALPALDYAIAVLTEKAEREPDAKA